MGVADHPPSGEGKCDNPNAGAVDNQVTSRLTAPMKERLIISGTKDMKRSQSEISRIHHEGQNGDREKP
jgi:hypothetical protein